MATGHILTRHYAGNGVLGDRIYERLRSLGFEERNPLSPEDTAEVDRAHVGTHVVTGFRANRQLLSGRRRYWLGSGSGKGREDEGTVKIGGIDRARTRNRLRVSHNTHR
jgi:hypothetical protein